MRLGLLLGVLWTQSAQGRTRDESSLGTSSFCLTGKKIPNVVGFRTLFNVVGPPSLRTVSRIEAVLPGVPSMGGLDRA